MHGVADSGTVTTDMAVSWRSPNAEAELPLPTSCHWSTRLPCNDVTAASIVVAPFVLVAAMRRYPRWWIEVMLRVRMSVLLGQTRQHRLERCEHVVLRHEAHLEVELVEFARAAVGARVFVAEARGDLEIFIEA